MALAFAIAQGFGFQEMIKNQLFEHFQEDREFLSRLFLFSDRMLEHTKGGILAIFGVLVLFWSATSLLSNLEQTFNYIWKVKESRRWRRMLSNYLAILLIAPFLLLLSSSLSLYAAGVIEKTLLGFLSDYPGKELSFLALRSLSLFFLCLLYTLLFYLLPNVKVSFFHALIGAFISAFLSIFVQNVYLIFQSSMSQYNAIYGSFAALPLFLIWVQINWFLLLFGVEISFACASRVQEDVHQTSLSDRDRLTLNLWIAKVTFEHMIREGKSVGPLSVSKELQIPYRLVTESLNQLCQAGILALVQDQQEYLPRCDPHSLRISDVIDALRKEKDSKKLIFDSSDFLLIQDTLEVFHQTWVELKENQLLIELGKTC